MLETGFTAPAKRGRNHMTGQGQPTAFDVLALESLGGDRFRALHNLDNLTGVNFGGQALGQALVAARATGAVWPASSLSGWFLRAGDPARPVDYDVARVADSRRFATRRVTASQDGEAIFEMLCAFHDPEPGVSHQTVAAPAVPAPEDLLSLQALVTGRGDRLPDRSAQLLARPFPIELRLTDPEGFLAGAPEPRRTFWFRIPEAGGTGEPVDHQALLALMSDYWLPGAIAAPHQRDGVMRSLASLNHALWFHGPARADEWLLYVTESHWADHGRGLSRGLIFSREGRLVATVVQEALLRWSPQLEARPAETNLQAFDLKSATSQG